MCIKYNVLNENVKIPNGDQVYVIKVFDLYNFVNTIAWTLLEDHLHFKNIWTYIFKKKTIAVYEFITHIYVHWHDNMLFENIYL